MQSRFGNITTAHRLTLWPVEVQRNVDCEVAFPTASEIGLTRWYAMAPDTSVPIVQLSVLPTA